MTPDDWADEPGTRDALDRWLCEAAAELPADFTSRVLSCLPPRRSGSGRRLIRAIEALLLAGGALFGFGQLLAFVFGLWAAGAAG